MDALWIIAAVILSVIVVVLARALFMKPTAAKTAKVQLAEGERAEKYGKQLAELIRKETISSRFDSDRTKFLREII